MVEWGGILKWEVAMRKEEAGDVLYFFHWVTEESM